MSPLLCPLLSLLLFSPPPLSALAPPPSPRRAFLAAAPLVLLPSIAAADSPSLPSTAAAAPPSLYSTAKSFYDAWNAGDVPLAVSNFSPDVTFLDAQYPAPFVGLPAVRAYLEECAASLPGWVFVIDDHAEDAGRRTLGLRWHVEGSGQVPLPFPSAGVSFVDFDERGRIFTVRDMVEPTVKLGKVQLPLLRAVTRVLGIK
ncbi:hypothetical protein TeGR_g3644 [Tetraparma gracilis]|uniref:SnoaL-like domain-containing protein n=1 Tax=Tetraparma gracilis TaxID=2962635 RepID=A0ABQ6MXF5_9STRA|nr:hypothetical protein TeGR_g3644 [Tetraparma gracilis]